MDIKFEEVGTILENKIEIPQTVQVVKPLPYFQLASLKLRAQVSFTDSGGIQKEAISWTRSARVASFPRRLGGGRA